MAIINNEYFYDYIKDELKSAEIESEGLKKMAESLPLGKFSYDDKGRFKIVYLKEREGAIGHRQEAWAKSAEGISLKLNKVVTGTFDAKAKCFTFDAECIMVKVGWWGSFSLISVKSVKNSENGKSQMEFSVKKNCLLKFTQTVPLSVFQQSSFKWSKNI